MIGKNGIAWPGDAIEMMRIARDRFKERGRRLEWRTEDARAYRRYRDAAIATGADVTNFPKSIGECDDKEYLEMVEEYGGQQ